METEPLCCTPVPGGVCGHRLDQHVAREVCGAGEPGYCPCPGYTPPTAAVPQDLNVGQGRCQGCGGVFGLAELAAAGYRCSTCAADPFCARCGVPLSEHNIGQLRPGEYLPADDPEWDDRPCPVYIATAARCPDPAGEQPPAQRIHFDLTREDGLMLSRLLQGECLLDGGEKEEANNRILRYIERALSESTGAGHQGGE